MVGADHGQARAVDVGPCIDRDAVLGIDARAAGGQAEAGTNADADRQGEHERIDVLFGSRLDCQVAAGCDAGVERIGLNQEGILRAANLLADEVARHRDADRDAHADAASTKRGCGRSDRGLDRGLVAGLDRDVGCGVERAALGIGPGPAQDRVVGHRTGARHRQAAHAGGNRHRGGDRQRVDRRILGRSDRDRAGRSRDVGMADRRLDAAVDGIVGNRDADRHRHTDNAEAGGDRRCVGVGLDVRQVLRQQHHAAGADDRVGGVVAVDDRGHVGRDAVVGHRTGAADGQAQVQAAGHGHRASEDEGLDRLLALRRDRQVAERADGRVLEIGPHLQRRGVQADQFPGVGVAVVLTEGGDLVPLLLVAEVLRTRQTGERQREIGADALVDLAADEHVLAHLDGLGLVTREVVADGEVVAQVLVDIALAHARSDVHRLALDQGQHVVGGLVVVELIGVFGRADKVARQRHADRRADAGVGTNTHADRRGNDEGVDLRRVVGADADRARARQIAVQCVGVRAAEDDVLGPGAGTADRDAGRGADADRHRRGGGHGMDAGVAGGGDRQRGDRDRHVGDRGFDIGARNMRVNSVVDGVARQPDADGNGNAHRTEGHRHRCRHGDRIDVRLVVGFKRHAVGRDVDAAAAVDRTAHIDTDAVLGKDAGTTCRHARTHADGDAHRHRGRQHQRVDALVGQRRQLQLALGVHRRFNQVGMHLERRGRVVAGLPADKIATHGHADRRTDADRAADRHGHRQRHDGGRNAGRALGAQRDIARAVDQADIRAIGARLAQDHVLRHRAGAADGDARRADADADRRGRGGRDRVDGVPRHAERERVARCTGALQHVGLAIGGHQGPARAGHHRGEPQLVDQQPPGGRARVAVVDRAQVDVDRFGVADVSIDAPGNAAMAGGDLHGRALGQVDH